jgi:hypothetical protein
MSENISETKLNNLYYIKFARSESEEMKQADYEILEYAYNLGMIIPNSLEVSKDDSGDIVISKKIIVNLYYEYFELMYNAFINSIIAQETLTENYQLFIQMSYSNKKQYLDELREIFFKAYEVNDSTNSILLEEQSANEMFNLLVNLPDSARLSALYYLQTGEELTPEIQSYLEQDLIESGNSIDSLTPEQVAYMAQTATLRYADKGAVVVNDTDVQIPNTNNPAIDTIRNNTPITRERLKEMMNNQTNAVDKLRQKNTKAYSNIPGLNRPSVPVANTPQNNQSYNDYQ